MDTFPNRKRIERIRKDVDRLFYVGIAVFGFFLLVPYLGITKLQDMDPILLIPGAILIFAPTGLALFWIEKKINNRKIWWTLGSLAWIGTFALALNGYHLK